MAYVFLTEPQNRENPGKRDSFYDPIEGPPMKWDGGIYETGWGNRVSLGSFVIHYVIKYKSSFQA